MDWGILREVKTLLSDRYLKSMKLRSFFLHDLKLALCLKRILKSYNVSAFVLPFNIDFAGWHNNNSCLNKFLTHKYTAIQFAI